MAQKTKKQKTKIKPKTKPKPKIKAKAIVKKKPIRKLQKKKKVIKVKPKAKAKKLLKLKPKQKLKPKLKTKKSKKRVIKIIKKRQTTRKIAVAKLKLVRHSNNPIMRPSDYSWESEAVMNPAAVVSGGVVHLFYRAMGPDGVSRIGYASSKDGINFDTRLTYPVFIAQTYDDAKKHWPLTSPARLVFDPTVYLSGGGWGGCEDPRAVMIEGTLYMTFNMFNGWHSMRVAVTSMKEQDLLDKKWNWQGFSYLSQPGDRQKNWVLFPEKINGKFALFYNLDKGDETKVHIAFMSRLNMLEAPSSSEAPDPHHLPDHDVAWHYRTRSAAAPPIKTKDGWLLLYHAMDKHEPNRYKVGAMLLDLKDPTKVLCRANSPILEPDEWYENDYKPGIVYVSGAVVLEGKLFVYYGGGDKYIAVATINLGELLHDMKTNKPFKLKNKTIRI